MPVIDDLRIKVESDARSALSNVDTLIDGLGRLKDALNGINPNKVTISSSAVKNMEALSKAVDKIDVQHLHDVQTALRYISGTIDGMGKLQNLGSLVTARQVDNMNGFAAAVQMLDMDKLRELESLDLSGITFASGEMREFDDFAKSTIVHLSRMEQMLSNVAGNMRKTGTQTEKTTRKVRSFGQVVRSVAEKVKGFASKFNILDGKIGNFLKSIGRIALYRAIRSAIKAITQGFSEGIEKLYHWSELVGTTFAPAMDRLATAADYLKRGFASMWSPLIEYAVPIIDTLVDKLVDFFNMAQEGFARLTGSATWTKALKVPKKFAEETDNAAASAKALHNILMDFDELNVINTPSSGGRSSGKEAEDYSGLFETVQTSLNNGKNWGQRLADLFNQMVNSPNWDGLEKKIGAGVNKILQPIHDFLSGADFKGLGYNLGNTLGEMIGEIDWDLFGETIGWTITDLLDFILGAIDGLLEHGEEIGQAFSDLMTGALNHLIDWTEDNTIADITDKITDGIVSIINGINFAEIMATIARLIVRIVLGIPRIFLSSIKAPFTIISGALRKAGLTDAADWIDENIIAPIDNAAVAYDNWADEVQKAADDAVAALVEESKVENEAYIASEKARKAYKNLNRETKTDTEAMLRAMGNAVTQWDTKNKLAFINSSTVVKSTMKESRLGVNLFENELNNLTATGKKTKDGTAKSFQDIEKESKARFSGAEGYVRSFKRTIEEVAEATKIDLSALQRTMQDRMSDINASWADCCKNIASEWNKLGSELKPLTVGMPGIERQSQADRYNRNYVFDPMLYDSGGFPSQGDLFIANERSPELIGTIGGRTAVASGNEITGIADAIREQGALERRALSELLGAVRSQRLTISPSAQLGQVVARSTRLWSGVTG